MTNGINIEEWVVVTTAGGKKTLGVPRTDLPHQRHERKGWITLSPSFEFLVELVQGTDDLGRQVLRKMPIVTTRDFLVDERMPVHLQVTELYELRETTEQDRKTYRQFVESAMQNAAQARAAAAGIVLPSKGAALGGHTR